AGFQALVGRYTGRSDVALGVPIAGRTRVETEGLIGFFVNSLVMRMDLGGEPTFRELIGRAQRIALDAYAHQEVPFERVVEAVRPERSLDRHPLVQVFFALQNAGGDRPSFDGLGAEPEPVPGDSAKFDVNVAATEGPAGL